MGADQDVVAILETPAEKLQSRLVRVNWAGFAALGFCLLVDGLWLGVTVREVAASLRDGQWDHHLLESSSVLQSLVALVPTMSMWFLVLKCFVAYPSQYVWLNMSLALREAAIDGDDELAPILVMRDGVPLQVDRLPRQYGLYKRPQALRALMRRLLAIAFALVGSLFLGGSLAVWLFAPHASARLNWTVVLAILGGMSLVGAILSARRARAFARPIEIAADDLGLTFTGPALRQPIHIVWSEIQAFFTCRYGNSLDPGKAYVVVGRTEAVGWIVDKRTRGVPLVGSEHLARVIESRGHVPLRDVTAMAEWLTSTRWSKKYRTGYERYQELARMRGFSSVKLWTPMRTRQLLRATLLLILLPLLPAPAVYVSGHLMQRAQEQRAEQELRQIHMHTPLYFNALTTPTGDWPEHAATDDNAIGYQATPSGYVISVQGGFPGDHIPTATLLGRRFGDVAVEVTVRANGGLYDGVGLSLHQSDGASDAVSFVVSPLDPTYPQWNVGHYGVPVTLSIAGWTNSDNFNDTGYFSFQQGNAIHTGVDVTNTLTAIIHGGDYTLFINGVYVGDFHDPYPHPGPVGVEAEMSNGTAVFTNFTVYPL